MGWIGFDLDGTLAKYDNWEGPTIIGSPITEIVNLAKNYISQGKELRVFTARMSVEDENEREAVAEAVADWTEQNGLGRLVATNKKDYGMITCYDDRCVQVIANMGVVVPDVYSQLHKSYIELVEENKKLKSALDSAKSSIANP